MKNTENVVIKKECHSQEFLLGISHIRFRKWVGSFKQVEDPRQNSSGMTTLFNNGAVVGQALPDNAPTKGHLAAFTLIELLVVVLIIGILAAVALPQYKVAVYKSRYATLKNIVKSIVNAEEVYYLANGVYTDYFEKLDVDMPGGKLNTSTDSRYIYDWGECNIAYYSNGEAHVDCKNSLINMTYGVYLSHSTYKPNKSRCLVLGSDISDDDIRHKVCKADGAKNFVGKLATYHCWEYLN